MNFYTSILFDLGIGYLPKLIRRLKDDDFDAESFLKGFEDADYFEEFSKDVEFLLKYYKAREDEFREDVKESLASLTGCEVWWKKNSIEKQPRLCCLRSRNTARQCRR